jgi:arginase
MAAISIICAPFHAGARAERVGAGPLRLLDDGIADALSRSGYQVRVTEIGSVDGFEGEIGRSFEVKRRVARAVAEAGEAGEFPIVLSGNCNVAVGVWSGLGRLDAGLVWFDAHPDFDTPDEHRSGYLDGMGVATLAGQCWRNLAGSIPGFTPFDLSRLTYCGIRDFEPGQLEKVKASGIAAAVGSKDRPTNYAAALRGQLDRAPFREAMIHLDLDCLDTSVGMANE